MISNEIINSNSYLLNPPPLSIVFDVKVELIPPVLYQHVCFTEAPPARVVAPEHTKTESGDAEGDRSLNSLDDV